MLWRASSLAFDGTGTLYQEIMTAVEVRQRPTVYSNLPVNMILTEAQKQSRSLYRPPAAELFRPHGESACAFPPVFAFPFSPVQCASDRVDRPCQRA